ncbi:MAG TPA: hypothetical protein VFI14_06665 [Chryseosolibacter sp.]|jgi:hypothetical protein|nr:hypothetical protein [Chryseosolibacter sp.]
MTFDFFKSSLSSPQPPHGVAGLLEALWYDANDNWDKAHSIAQEIDSRNGAWVHAYLHRREGDHGNAAYWYHRAGKPVSRASLGDEWESIVKVLLTAK